MEMSASLVDLAVLKGEWRCVSMACGELFVITPGYKLMPTLFAGNLDTLMQVF